MITAEELEELTTDRIDREDAKNRILSLEIKQIDESIKMATGKERV